MVHLLVRNLSLSWITKFEDIVGTTFSKLKLSFNLADSKKDDKASENTSASHCKILVSKTLSG